MDRRVFVMTFGLGLAVAGMSVAAGFEDSVVAQLQAQGYGKITLEHTLLGRVRIVAQMGAMRREIVLNPRTGEVLRDVVVDQNGDVALQIDRKSQSGDGGTTGGGNSNSGGSGSDDGAGDDGGNDDGGNDDGGNDDGGNDDGGSGGSGNDGSGGSDDGGDDGGGDDRGEDDGGEDENDN